MLHGLARSSELCVQEQTACQSGCCESQAKDMYTAVMSAAWTRRGRCTVTSLVHNQAAAHLARVGVAHARGQARPQDGAPRLQHCAVRPQCKARAPHLHRHTQQPWLGGSDAQLNSMQQVHLHLLDACLSAPSETCAVPSVQSRGWRLAAMCTCPFQALHCAGKKPEVPCQLKDMCYPLPTRPRLLWRHTGLHETRACRYPGTNQLAWRTRDQEKHCTNACPQKTQTSQSAAPSALLVS